MKTTIRYAAPFIIPKTLPHAEGLGEDDIFGDSITETPEGLLLRSNCGSTLFREYALAEGGWQVRGVADYDGATCAINAVWGIEFPPCEFGAVSSTWGYFQTMEAYELERRRRRSIRGADALTIDGLDALRRIQWAVTCAIRDGKIGRDAATLRAALAELSAAVGTAIVPVAPEDCAALCAALGFQPADE